MNISVFLFDLGYEKTFDYPRKKKKKKQSYPGPQRNFNKRKAERDIRSLTRHCSANFSPLLSLPSLSTCTSG